jgi:hypothetical protein
MNRKLFTILLMLVIGHTKAQSLENNPFSHKWSYSKSKHFRIIYPRGLDTTGLYMLNRLEYYYAPLSKSLGADTKPISVILQNLGTESNGFVSTVPRRSEFFISSPQNTHLLGTNHWIDLLARHEFRHVVQFDKTKTGFGKVTHALFGNAGQTVIREITTPRWFLEGDATVIETAHGPMGRGNIPAFSAQKRALLLADVPMNYSRATGGSFKQSIPNFYVHGVFLSSYMKDKYGNDVWDKLFGKLYKFPFYPSSFSHNISKFSGKSIDKTYLAMDAELKEILKKETTGKTTLEKYYVKTANNKVFTSYTYPNELENNTLVCLKTGLDIIPTIVQILPDGTEKKLFETGFINNANNIAANGNKLVWAEEISDIRRALSGKNNIKVYDHTTGKVQNIVKNSRLFSPAISHDGRMLAAVDFSINGKASLVIVNAESGVVVDRFEGLACEQLLHPQWSKNDELLYFVAIKDGKKAIYSLAVNNGNYTALTEWTNNNIGHVVENEGFVYFNNASDGVDNVFRVNINTKVVEQCTNAPIGVFNAKFSRDLTKVYLNEWTVNGMRIAKLPIGDLQSQTIQLDQTKQPSYFSSWMPKERAFIESQDPDLVQNQVIKSGKFSEARLLNIDTWGLLLNSDATGMNIGVSSQNLLSTMQVGGGLQYNISEQAFGKEVFLRYEGMFPILNVNYNQTPRSTFIPKGALPEIKQDLNDTWTQKSLEFSVGLPFTFQQNKYTSKLLLQTGARLLNGSGYDLNYATSQTSIGKKDLVTNIIALQFSRQIRTAARDVRPRWAQSIFAYTQNKLGSSQIGAGLTALQASLNFPGMFKHDVLRLRAGYQSLETAPGKYILSSPLPFARGYSYLAAKNTSLVSADYSFPVAYPDFNISKFLYFQRINANVFFDQANSTFKDYSKNTSQTYNYNSFGVDVSTLFNVLRYHIPIEVGVRVSYAGNEIINPNNKIQITPLLLNLPF